MELSPKEKAKELVEKFNPYCLDCNNTDISASIQCAIIAVNEMIKSERNALIKFNIVTESYIPKYYNEVKEEINKL